MAAMEPDFRLAFEGMQRAAGGGQPTPEQVEAIAVCREKLREDGEPQWRGA